MGPTSDSEKGALLQTCGLRAVSPGLRPRRRRPPGPRAARTQEGPPALPHPPRPLCAGGSRARASQPVRAASTMLLGCPDLRPSMGAAVLRAVPFRPPCRVGVPPQLAPVAPGPAVAQGRSPLRQSPAMQSLAGEPRTAWALRRPQGGRVLAGGRRLRAAPPPLTPPPRQERTRSACGAPLGGGARGVRRR